MAEAAVANGTTVSQRTALKDGVADGALTRRSQAALEDGVSLMVSRRMAHERLADGEIGELSRRGLAQGLGRLRGQDRKGERIKEGTTVCRMFPSRTMRKCGRTSREGRTKRLLHEENVHLLVFLVVGDIKNGTRGGCP